MGGTVIVMVEGVFWCLRLEPSDLAGTLVRRHLFYLLDYVTPSRKYLIGDRKENINWFGEMHRYVSQFLVFRFFERKTLLDHTPKPHDPFFADFAAEIAVFGWKPWILSIVGGANCQNLRFSVENRGFWLKTTDFGRKLRIMVKNYGLWSKTVDFRQKLRILQFLSLKLQNCLLVFSPERGSKG